MLPLVRELVFKLVVKKVKDISVFVRSYVLNKTVKFLHLSFQPTVKIDYRTVFYIHLFKNK